MSEAQNIFGVENSYRYFVVGILVIFGLLETINGYLKRSKRTSNDWIQEAGGFLILSVLIKPMIVLAVLFIGNLMMPAQSSLLTTVSLWISLPLYLFVDDLLQYWYHRSAHEYDFLWKLHRPHHQAEEMGFFVSYRNAGLYYLLMPNIWWIGIITFLGGGKAVAIGLILKQLVIIGSHSTVKWDKPFYKIPVLRSIIALIQRVIITPAFHHAHHGKSKIDGISNPNGNFGNMFSLWDQLFGSATFTNTYPSDYGLPNNPNEHWSEAYLYPLVKSKNPESELSKDFTKNITATCEPLFVELNKGEKYLWCRCGMSKNQPFCDGTHHGSKFKPELFEAKKTGKVKLCNCKKTKVAPYCDNSHVPLTDQRTMK